MSVKSSQSVNSPVPASGVSYTYPASGPIPLKPSSLGYQYRVTSGAVVTPIPASSINFTQLYLQSGSVGAGIPAGTYIVFADAVVNDILGDLNTFIRIVDSATGLVTIIQGAGSYQGALAQFQSMQPSLVFTATQDFIVQSFLNTGGAGGSGTPEDVGSLQVVRIA